MNPNESHPFPFYPPVQPSLPGAVGPMQPTYSYPSVFVPSGQAMYPFQLAQDGFPPVQIPAANLSTSTIPSVAQNTSLFGSVLHPWRFQYPQENLSTMQFQWPHDSTVLPNDSTVLPKRCQKKLLFNNTTDLTATHAHLPQTCSFDGRRGASR